MVGDGAELGGSRDAHPRIDRGAAEETLLVGSALASILDAIRSIRYGSTIGVDAVVKGGTGW